MTMRILTLLVVLLASPWAAAVEAGHFIFVRGDVRVHPAAGGERPAAKSQSVLPGDRLVTGEDGAAQLRMIDDAVIVLRPRTELRIEAYHYDGKADGSEKGIFELLRGGFRSITGLIGRLSREAYSVRTPTATIGIRGTDHEPFHIPPPAAGETAPGEPGTYDKVNSGETYIQTAAGRVIIGPNQAGFAPVRADAPPVRLDRIPEFLRAGVAGLRPRDLDRARDAVKRLAPGDRPRPNLPDGNLPAPVLPPRTESGSVDLAAVAARLTEAPVGYVVVGGDVSPGPEAGIGSGVVPVNGFTAGLDAAGLPVVLGSNTFGYARGGAPLAQVGEAVVDGTRVNWGLYAGGVLVDASGARAPLALNFAAATQITPPASWPALASRAYTAVLGATRPVAESGTIGGTVAAFGAAVNFSAGTLTAYALRVQDTAGRTWIAQLAVPSVALTTFIQSGAPLSGTCQGGACASLTPLLTAPAPDASRAIGAPVGPNGGGLLSAYRLSTGSLGVSGSIVAH